MDVLHVGLVVGVQDLQGVFLFEEVGPPLSDSSIDFLDPLVVVTRHKCDYVHYISSLSVQIPSILITIVEVIKGQLPESERCLLLLKTLLDLIKVHTRLSQDLHIGIAVKLGQSMLILCKNSIYGSHLMYAFKI